MPEIDIVNTVNVTLTGTPRGLSNFVVANTILLTNEKAGFSDEYKAYVSANEGAEDFGSDSVTYYMMQKAFAVTPNLRSGNGTLYVVPYVATNATSGNVTTDAIVANLDNFKNVTNGELQLAINGKTVKLTKMNFTGIKTVADIVKVILNKNPDCYVEVIDKNKIKFTSKLFGEDSTINVEKFTSGAGDDISGATFLNAQSLTPTSGTNSVDTETASEALLRVLEKISAGVVLDTCYRENASIKAMATTAETLDIRYVDVTSSLKNIEVLGKEIIEGGFTHTKILAYSLGAKEAKGMLAGYTSYGVSTNWSGTNTAITMNLKELATVDPDKNLTQTYFELAKKYGVDIYGNTKGLACVYSFKNAGGYFDDQIGNLALQKDLETKGFNYLRQIGTKVPQTEQGMTELKDALAVIWEKYVTNGFLGTGLKWNNSKFGDPEDFDRNIYEKGYYQYSIPVAEQDQTEREERKAPLIQSAGKSAGAVHVVNINGTIEK